MSFELILPFLRPIEPLLLDDTVSEIMGNPDASWWYERDGMIHRDSESRCIMPSRSYHHEASGLPMISLTVSSSNSGSMGRRNGRINSKLIAGLYSDGRPA